MKQSISNLSVYSWYTYPRFKTRGSFLHQLCIPNTCIYALTHFPQYFTFIVLLCTSYMEIFCICVDGVVTLTSSARGGICPGQEVTLTCIVTGGVLLEWSSTAFSNPVRFAEGSTLGQPINRGVFTATLISETENVNPSLSDLTSTLRVTATPQAMLNGTVVTCRDQLNPRSITLILAGVCACVRACACMCVCVRMRLRALSAPGREINLCCRWDWTLDLSIHSPVL